MRLLFTYTLTHLHARINPSQKHERRPCRQLCIPRQKRQVPSISRPLKPPFHLRVVLSSLASSFLLGGVVACRAIHETCRPRLPVVHIRYGLVCLASCRPVPSPDVSISTRRALPPLHDELSPAARGGSPHGKSIKPAPDLCQRCIPQDAYHYTQSYGYNNTKWYNVQAIQN